MNRTSNNQFGSPGWPRRLLGRLARAMGATIDWPDKPAALRRAARTVHSGPLPARWIYTDAVLVRDVWLCVLERSTSVHLVEVDAGTGDTRTVASSTRRGRAGHRGHTRRTVLISCAGRRGDPPFVTASQRSRAGGNRVRLHR